MGRVRVGQPARQRPVAAAQAVAQRPEARKEAPPAPKLAPGCLGALVETEELRAAGEPRLAAFLLVVS